jgi:hypothetical protein
LESSSEVIGNSSKNTITIGTRALAGTTARAGPLSPPPTTSLPTGETVTNSRGEHQGSRAVR